MKNGTFVEINNINKKVQTGPELLFLFLNAPFC